MAGVQQFHFPYGHGSLEIAADADLISHSGAAPIADETGAVFEALAHPEYAARLAGHCRRILSPNIPGKMVGCAAVLAVLEDRVGGADGPHGGSFSALHGRVRLDFSELRLISVVTVTVSR